MQQEVLKPIILDRVAQKSATGYSLLTVSITSTSRSITLSYFYSALFDVYLYVAYATIYKKITFIAQY